MGGFDQHRQHPGTVATAWLRTLVIVLMVAVGRLVSRNAARRVAADSRSDILWDDGEPEEESPLA